MSEILNTKTAEISANEKSIIAELTENSVKVRVSPNSYFIAIFLATFFTGLLVYLELDLYAALLGGLSWTLIPFAIWTDKISFDGKQLTRTGIVPRVWA